MTLIEPFDRDPLQNIAGCLSVKPDLLYLVVNGDCVNYIARDIEPLWNVLKADTTNWNKKVNDPNSKARSEKLWDLASIKGQIRNLWVCQK